MKKSYIQSFCTFLSLCFFNTTLNIDVCHTPCSALKEGPVTIFIHGTVFKGVARMLGHHEERRGLYRYTAHPKRLTALKRIGKSLYLSDPTGFPLDTFYKFYWPGDLSLHCRKQAAKDLFALLKDHKGSCTIIAHSHGCNVALHLVEHAENLVSFSIDRLILLAPPVQDITAQFVHNPIFIWVYSCYSSADMIQVADPQGIKKEMHTKRKPSLFSKRTYAKDHNLTQAEILSNYRGIGHQDFISPSFFSQLPAILTLLDTSFARQEGHVIINMRSQGSPPQLLIEKKQETGMLRFYRRSVKYRK